MPNTRKPPASSEVVGPRHTPTRTFRVPPAVYERAQARATQRGETVTAVVVRALDRYGKKKP